MKLAAARRKRYEQLQAQEAAHLEVAKQRRSVELWANSGVGKDTRHSTANPADLMGHAKWAAAWVLAKKAVDGNGIVAMLGDRGNGKTQMGVELIKHVCRQQKRAVYIRSRVIGMEIRSSYNSTAGPNEIDIVNKYTKPHLLVIDELHEKPDTDFEMRTMTMIMDIRYDKMRPTILIANASQPAFKKIVGASVIDRIKEGGGILMFDWPSFRGA